MTAAVEVHQAKGYDRDFIETFAFMPLIDVISASMVNHFPLSVTVERNGI